MHPRASILISALGLLPHPEGGYFREIHRSPMTIHTNDGRADRAALTVIYFLLAADGTGGGSRWHCVASDEAWHFHEGDPIELFVSDPTLATIAVQRLGPWAVDTEPVRVVPAGSWQAARAVGAFALVSCTVAPGFEFNDFELLRDRPADADRFVSRHPSRAT